MKKRLVKSSTNKMIDGVCGGIADTYDIDVSLLRLGFVLATLFSSGIFGLIYLIAMVVIPRDYDIMR